VRLPGRDGNGEFPVGDQPPIPVPAGTHFPRPRPRQHLRGEIFYRPRPPRGIHPRRGPRPREMAQRTDVPTLAAGVAHGGEGLVRPSCGWRRRRAGTGGRHTTAQRKDGEATAQRQEGEGPVPQPATAQPRSARKGGAAPPADDCATQREEGLAAGR
jgi:hypothetical protein